MFVIDDAIDSYADDHSAGLDELRRELVEETKQQTTVAQMLSTHTSGQFLTLLARVLNPQSVLEVGTFTGFGTLCLLEGLSETAKIVTCELDSHHAAIAQKYFDRHPLGKNVRLEVGPALDTIEAISTPIDLAFIDADKENYPNYYRLIMDRLRSGGLLVVDNALWSGSVLDPKDEASKAIHATNVAIRDDERALNVLLTVKDGMHLVLKR